MRWCQFPCLPVWEKSLTVETISEHVHMSPSKSHAIRRFILDKPSQTIYGRSVRQPFNTRSAHHLSHSSQIEGAVILIDEADPMIFSNFLCALWWLFLRQSELVNASLIFNFRYLSGILFLARPSIQYTGSARERLWRAVPAHGTWNQSAHRLINEGAVRNKFGRTSVQGSLGQRREATQF